MSTTASPTPTPSPSQPSPPTPQATPPQHPPSSSSASTTTLDLSSLPPVFVLAAHLSASQLQEAEEALQRHGAPLTFDMREARLVLGKVGTRRRAEFELRTRRLRTEEVGAAAAESGGVTGGDGDGGEEGEERPAKRRRGEEGKRTDIIDSPEHVNVVKIEWLHDCLSAGEFIPLSPYLIYRGRVLEQPTSPILSSSPTRSTRLPAIPNTSTVARSHHRLAERPQTDQSILERARADAESRPHDGGKSSSSYHTAYGSRRFGRGRHSQQHSATQRTHLLHQTTSDREDDDDNGGNGGSRRRELPAPPEWVKQRVKYACQRSTRRNPPNDAFIEQLKTIRLGRTLTEDEIGVRAYSTAIAAIAAYPHPIRSAREVLRLPGCDVKIATLWSEWAQHDGHIAAVQHLLADETLRVLRLFYDIWGVGATTARAFWDRGWRDLDDVVEFGWADLTRVQQIGVKFYDEFKLGIPRREVEGIARTIGEHARRVRDEGVQLLVVGGYRRGKEEAGDVDLIVSHRSLHATANLVTDIVASLETEGWVTHTLLLSLQTTARGQATLPFRGGRPAGAGFDSLDKALVVWQDPHWPGREVDLATDPKAKNPNIHRRVDIIVSPWRTVGCAVCGWSGGTTFQRDIRRYAKHKKNWKFDSSGVRDRSTGRVVPLEGADGVEGSMVDAEKTVFEGLGLVWREPEERWTG